MLPEKEVDEIKQKIISHIKETFPPEKIDSAINQIEQMNSEQLENFLEENNLVSKGDSNCVFCSIIAGKINSVKIDEDEHAVAVLELNPISKGHTLVIPKEHIGEIKKEILSFAEKVGKKIKEKFGAKKIEISKSKIFGHETISILPIYNNETLESEKKHAEFSELEKIKKELDEEEIPVPLPPQIQEKKEESIWLPKRIP
jgi:histidine triad (HIT) family protein